MSADLTGWDDDPLGMPDPARYGGLTDEIDRQLLDRLLLQIEWSKALRALRSDPSPLSERGVTGWAATDLIKEVGKRFADGEAPIELERVLIEHSPQEWKHTAARHRISTRDKCTHCGKLLEPSPRHRRQWCQVCLGL